MKDEEIRKIWKDFNDKYEDLFKTNNEKWNDNLEKVEEYIIKYKILPSICDKDNEIKTLGSWLSHQKTNYKNNINLLKVPKFRQMWEDFVKEYNYLL